MKCTYVFNVLKNMFPTEYRTNIINIYKVTDKNLDAWADITVNFRECISCYFMQFDAINLKISYDA